MQSIYEVSNATATLHDDGFSTKFVYVTVAGSVRTSGWSDLRLLPRIHVVEPADGIWDIDVVGEPATGPALQIITPVALADTFIAPPWLKGVRLHSETNALAAEIASYAEPAALFYSAFTAPANHVIVKQDLAVYDDSFQPTGKVRWEGLVPHFEMKKLRHTLTLTVTGPDRARIEDCIRQAATVGLIAAIIAAYTTGGLALGVAISAFTAKLTDCLGDSFSIAIDNNSHWIYWYT